MIIDHHHHRHGRYYGGGGGINNLNPDTLKKFYYFRWVLLIGGAVLFVFGLCCFFSLPLTFASGMGFSFVQRKQFLSSFSVLTAIQIVCWMGGMMGGFIMLCFCGIPLVCSYEAFKARQEHQGAMAANPTPFVPPPPAAAAAGGVFVPPSAPPPQGYGFDQPPPPPPPYSSDKI